MKMQIEIEITTPHIPDVLQIKGGEQINIEKLTEMQLEQVADNWKAKLLRKRREKLTHTRTI